MPIAEPAEVAFFDAVVQTATRLHGSGHPAWYLAARLDQMLDDHGLEGRLRDDAAARAFFILVAMARSRPRSAPESRSAVSRD